MLQHNKDAFSDFVDSKRETTTASVSGIPVVI